MYKAFQYAFYYICKQLELMLSSLFVLLSPPLTPHPSFKVLWRSWMARQRKLYSSCLLSGDTGINSTQPFPSQSHLSSQTTYFPHNNITSIPPLHPYIKNGICCKYFFILASFSSSSKRIKGLEGKWYTGFPAELQMRTG